VNRLFAAGEGADPMGFSIEELMKAVAAMDREGCIAQLRELQRPKLDFTEEFLRGQTLERLRHIVAAAFIQARKLPG